MNLASRLPYPADTKAEYVPAFVEERADGTALVWHPLDRLPLLDHPPHRHPNLDALIRRLNRRGFVVIHRSAARSAA